MPLAYDKSEHQNPYAGPYGDAEIIRAGNGRRKDYDVNAHIAAARARGLPVSLYLYCEPSSTSAEWQAELLCAVANEVGIPKSVTLYADIEEGAGDLRWFEDRFIARVVALGWPCDTYSGDYFFRAHNLAGRRDPWKAAYGNNDGNRHSPPGEPWSLWQFTSNPLDTNDVKASAFDRVFRGAAPAPASQPKGTGQMFAVHLVSAPEVGYPGGMLFVGEVGAWIECGLAFYAEALRKGAYQVTVNAPQWDWWNAQQRLDGSGQPIAANALEGDLSGVLGQTEEELAKVSEKLSAPA